MKNYPKPRIKGSSDLKARKRLLKAYIRTEEHSLYSFTSVLEGILKSKTALIIGTLALRVILKRWSH